LFSLLSGIGLAPRPRVRLGYYDQGRTPAGDLAGYREKVSAESPASVPGIRSRYWIPLDIAVAALFAVVIVAALFKNARGYPFPATSAGDWLLVLLALCLAAPIAIRRRNPLGALAMVLVASAVSVVIGAGITAGLFLPMALVLYVVAVTCRSAVAVIGLAASVAVLAVQGLILNLNGHGPGNAVGASLVMITTWTVAYTVRQRRAYMGRLRDQAAAAAVTEERLRIARELHDVVAHSMTVVAVQAGFGEYIFDSQPGEARAALGAIQTVSREALNDMQQLLGVLRQSPAAELRGKVTQSGRAGGPDPAGQGGGPDGHGPGALSHDDPGAVTTGAGQTPAWAAAPLAPAPGLADLDRLTARTAGAGVQVAIERTGEVRDLPAGVDLSAYRIVQEALTNVVKHSGADSCRVVIGYGDSDLSIEITDLGPARVAALVGWADGVRRAPLTACAGHGLIGMRERVSLCGGEFSAEPLPDQGFRVAARLPLATGAQ
jgi:signal transduction histidine kinase